MKKYIAEVLGTGFLTLVVSLSLTGIFPVSTPVLAGLVLCLFVYSIGHISGTHINPAVTIGLWSVKKIGNRDAVMYIVSQFVGAFIAGLIVAMTVKQRMLPLVNSFPVGFAEMLGAFFFTFGIASVVFEKTHTQLSGIVIGGSLFIGIAIAVLLGSNGVLNPAVAFGIGSFNITYFIAPIVGSVLGMRAYKAVAH